MNEETNILIYQTEDGQTRIDIKLENKTLWMNQKQIAELFQITKQTVGHHIIDILNEENVDENTVVRKYLTTAEDGKEYQVLHYNLDLVLLVGYRVRSHRGAQFRRWASEILKEYLEKGFAMNDQRLKSMKNFGEDYFDELLERIRDIRASEKRFYSKVLDIYATSVDYDGKAEISQEFFKTVQNKMHFSVSGQTAAEIIYDRADANKKNMGLTTFESVRPKKSEVTIAKNYLYEAEIDTLNRIVSMYLDYAEMQAKNKKEMYMKDWIEKLDAFLKFNDRDILDNPGKISHEQAVKKALGEFEKYKQRIINQEKSLAEIDFESSIKELEDLSKQK